MSGSVSNEVQNLIDQFNRQLQVTLASYPDYKINDDSEYEKNVDILYGILAQIDALQSQTSSNISANDALIQGMLDSISDLQDSNVENSDAYYTVKQTLDDSRANYDKDKIILVLKICIVAFIFIKGNDVYVRNQSLFIGLILVLFSSYGVLVYLYT